MNLQTIPIHSLSGDGYSVGSIRALLAEIAALLENLVQTGESGMIDLNSLPLPPANTNSCGKRSRKAKFQPASRPSVPAKSSRRATPACGG